MTPGLTTADTVDALIAVCHTMIASEDQLAKADREVGDGDHGQGIARGFTAVLGYLRTVSASTPHEVLRGVGTTLIASMGGASGVVFGTMFGGSRSVTFDGDLTVMALAEHLGAAVAEIERRGGAAAGQKTMLDALIPAVDSLLSEPADSAVAPALTRAAEAAAEGAEATRDMVARFGKSATMGVRSLGFSDPGAISVALILGEMAASATRRTLSDTPSTN